MTKSAYARYQAAVDHNLKGLAFVSTGACTGCTDCGLPTIEEPDPDEDWYDKERREKKTKEIEHARECADEGGFSWSGCDCCGSTLGGQRYAAHGVSTTDQRLSHLDVCVDCLYYINYGCLDDTQME